MPKRIEFEGKVHEFPDDFTNDDIGKALKSLGSVQQPAQAAAPTQPSEDLDNPMAMGAATRPSDILNFGKGMINGAVKHVAQTFFGPEPTGSAATAKDLNAGTSPSQPGQQVWRNPRTGQAYLPPTPQQVEDSKPHGVAESVGAGAVQTAELAAGGNVGRAVVGKVLSKTPRLARMVADAAVTGGNAYMHGQDPKTAALVGAGVPAVLENATEVAPKVAPKLMDMARRIYQSALKPGPGTYSTPEVQQMIETALENEIPVSPKGAEKLSGLIDDLNDKIKQTIARNPTAPINPTKVASRVEQVRPTFDTVNPEDAQATLTGVKSEYLNKHSIEAPYTKIKPASESGLDDVSGAFTEAGAGVNKIPQEYSAAEAQLEKQKTYTQLRKSYGELKGAEIEGQKALARGIKEELQVWFPEIKDLNAKESKAIGLDEALLRAVRRIENRNLLSLGGRAIAGGVGVGTGLMTGNAVAGVGTAAASAVMHEAVTNPAVQSRLAIALYNAGKKLPGQVTTPAMVRAALQAYVNRLGAYKANQSTPAGQQTNPPQTGSE